MAIEHKIFFVHDSRPERYWEIGLNLSDPSIGVVQSWSESMDESEIRALHCSRGFSVDRVTAMMEDAKRRDARTKYAGENPPPE